MKFLAVLKIQKKFSCFVMSWLFCNVLVLRSFPYSISLPKIVSEIACYWSVAFQFEKFENFSQVKYHLACHFFFTCQKWRALVCCRSECSHNRHLFLVLLPYTKLVYLTVLIFDVSANILY